MPIVPSAVTGIALANLSGNAMIGASAIQIASALGLGLSTYLIGPLVVNSIDTGTAGAGSGIGPGPVLAPNILQGNLVISFTAAGLIGPAALPVINAIAYTVPAALLLGIVTTVNIGVGTGAGVVTLVPNPAASVPIMINAFAANGMTGIRSVGMATAIAVAIDSSLPSAVGAVAIAGPPSIVPSIGTGIGKII